MDALYFLRHSPHADLELRYSLRSVERHMPWVRKVWVFGDRPEFLTDDAMLAEHVPHEAVAWVGKHQTPVRNFFLLYYLSVLLPGLSEEYIRFSDDFILLDDMTPERARTVRYLQDLSKAKSRGQGLWKESLWRTHDLLRRLDYPALNYETHTPAYFRREWVLNAFRDLRDYVTEDRFQGPLGATAVLRAS